MCEQYCRQSLAAVTVLIVDESFSAARRTESGVGFPPARGSGERCKHPHSGVRSESRTPNGFHTFHVFRVASPGSLVLFIVACFTQTTFSKARAMKTSCRLTAAKICLRPPCKLTVSSYLFARWRCCSGITIFSCLFRHVGYSRHQQQVDLRPFDLETGVRITCDVGYLCANFSLPMPLCSRVRPDVRDRQT